MNYTGAIFDMDGVLFDTEKLYQETWGELAAKRGIRLPQSFVKAISGTSGDRMVQVIEEYYQTSDGRVPDGAAIAKECMERMQRKLAVQVPVKQGVVEILEYFRQKDIRLAVASSSSVQQITSNLSISGIGQYFRQIVSGAEVCHGKPAPDIFLTAAGKIGCKPEECLVFEDSENGVRAGRAAGCFTIMIPDLIAPSEEIKAICSAIYPDFFQVRHALACSSSE